MIPQSVENIFYLRRTENHSSLKLGDFTKATFSTPILTSAVGLNLTNMAIILSSANCTIEFSLRLPGFSISVLRYINDKTHKLRYVFKNNKTGDLYFAVTLTLLFGEELEAALKVEEQRWAKADAVVADASNSADPGPQRDGAMAEVPGGKENTLSREQAYLDGVD
jgi:hypothetical protein